MGKVAGRKKRIIGTTVALVAIGGGAAFAYWSATGTHDTSTAAGTATNFTVTSEITGDPLSPNGPVKTATFTVTNPGTGVQKLSNMAVTVAGTGGAAWTPAGGCTAADFKVGTPSFTATEIKAGEYVTGTVTLQMIDRPGVNQDGCKGAAVPLHFAAS
jgi:hypothetical protein